MTLPVAACYSIIIIILLMLVQEMDSRVGGCCL